MADTSGYFKNAFRDAVKAGRVRKRTVFVVTVEGDEWSEPFGVYATYERAERAVTKYSDEINGREHDICEMPVWK